MSLTADERAELKAAVSEAQRALYDATPRPGHRKGSVREPSAPTVAQTVSTSLRPAPTIDFDQDEARVYLRLVAACGDLHSTGMDVLAHCAAVARVAVGAKRQPLNKFAEATL